MTAFEQQVLKALKQIADQVGSLQAGMTTSWWGRWGSLLGVVASVLVALVGWWFIAKENRRNNRDAFRLQLADAARNRILDSLYDYREFLFDVESPKRLLQRDKSTLRKLYVRRGQPAPVRPEDTLLCFEVEEELLRLAYVDQRPFDCFKIMRRDEWALDVKARARVASSLSELENMHEKIIAFYVEYVDEATDQLRRDLRHGFEFIMGDRGAKDVNMIDVQTLLVNTTAVSLQRRLE